MKTFPGGKRGAFLALALVLAGPAVPTFAQNAESSEARLRRIEAEIRALQRQVFPGGDGRYFPAQVQPAQGASPAPSGAPATTPVTDLLTRMDAVEAQIARLTSQTEVNTNRLSQLEARLNALAPTPSPTPSAAPTPSPTPTPAATPRPTPTPAASATPRPTPTPTASASPSAQRVAAVRAIVKPQTDDPGDDEYSYGFRLWEARFYPEAQQQLRAFLQRYPRHERVSYARNLMGRTYLDDGQPREAAQWFLQNHQADPRGARAPDSLLFLAEAMKRLRDNNRACIALAQFADDYAAEAAGRLRAQYEQTRTGLTCN